MGLPSGAVVGGSLSSKRLELGTLAHGARECSDPHEWMGPLSLDLVDE